MLDLIQIFQWNLFDEYLKNMDNQSVVSLGI